MTIGLTGKGLLFRFLGALILVFATYNPFELSYIDWLIAELDDINENDFNVLVLFVGVVLLIGWVMFLRATYRSLGVVGLILAVAFFGSFFWLLIYWGFTPLENIKILIMVILVLVAAVLTVGVSWSHIRRRFSGQVDVDEIESD